MDALNLRTLYRFAAALFLVTALTNCPIVQAQTLVGASLVQQLRQGGYVILMRHAHAPGDLPDSHTAAAGNIRRERQLDETGRSTARAMGEAIKKLHIPIGAVLSSPTYRALETVRLAALGPVRTYTELGDGGQSMSADAVAGQSGWLHNRVVERPKAGWNTIIVTHMPNIQAAFAQEAGDLTDGEALVFHPDGHGGANLVAKVRIEDWTRLALDR